MLIRLRCHNISYLNANVDDAVIIIYFLECKNEPLLSCSIAKNRHWAGPQGSRRPTAHHPPARARAIQTVSVQTDIVSWNPGDTAAAAVTSEQVPPVRGWSYREAGCALWGLGSLLHSHGLQHLKRQVQTSTTLERVPCTGPAGSSGIRGPRRTGWGLTLPRFG